MNNIHKIGYRSGLIAFGATVAFGIVQSLQLLRFLHYPWDEILIYGTSLCIVIPFMFEFLAFHHVTPADKKIWSHAALLFTLIYVVFVTANYVVQLATVIPMTRSGVTHEIDILRQTPHSLFWDFDAIGYIAMGLATLSAVPVFTMTGFDKWVKYGFLAHAIVTPLIAYVYFYPVFSEKLLLMGIPWAITAPLSMLLLAIWFTKGVAKQNDNMSF
jgi:hypothetical protein